VVTEVASLVLFTSRLDEAVAFYRALGVELEAEDHGDGLVHAATDLGDVHVAVLPASTNGEHPPWRGAGSTFSGFYVPSLDETLVALTALGTEVLLDHQACEWGCRVVVADPDGRAVEVNQRHHCPDQPPR